MKSTDGYGAEWGELSKPTPRKDFGDGKFQEDKYYDAHGKQTHDISKARSKVESRPWDFRHFVKVEYITWWGLGQPAIKWVYHHTSSTAGCWMWPQDMPLRFDGVDNFDIAIDHAAKLGSTWRPGVDV